MFRSGFSCVRRAFSVHSLVPFPSRSFLRRFATLRSSLPMPRPQMTNEQAEQAVVTASREVEAAQARLASAQAALERLQGPSSAAPPFVQPCSCLWCWQGQSTGRDRVEIRMGSAVYLGPEGYMKENASDDSQRVRCVKCHECEKARWYLAEHMCEAGWWNDCYFTKSDKYNFWCKSAFPHEVRPRRLFAKPIPKFRRLFAMESTLADTLADYHSTQTAFRHGLFVSYALPFWRLR